MNTSMVETPMFDKVRQELSKNRPTPFTVFASNRDKIAFVFNTYTDTTEHKKIRKNIKWSYEGGLKCRLCDETLEKLIPMYFKNGSVFKNICVPVYKELGKQGPIKSETVKLSEELGIVSVLTKNIGKETSGHFPHFYVKPKELSQLRRFNAEEYEKFFNQNLPTMIRVLETNGEGIIESLEILIDNLEKITYGDKLLNSAKWLLNTCREFYSVRAEQEKYAFAAKWLLKAPLTKGTTCIEITYLKQVKDNTLSALAVCKNKEKLRALLEARFHPEDYQQRKAPPTKGQLRNALKICKGNLKFSLMKLSSITEYGGRLISPKNESKDAISAWSQELEVIENKDKLRKNSAAGNFASRCNRMNIKTIKQLFEYSNLEGLEMYINGTAVVLTKFPHKSKEMFIHPHSWGFRNDKPLSEIGLQTGTWKPVSALHFFGINFIACIDGAKVPAHNLLGNTAHAEFLTPAYNRKLGPAMAHLNRTTTMCVPDGQGAKYAIGIGDSMKNKTTRQLNSYHKFRLNGKEFVINKM
jgi:hypothetical protein